MKLALPQIRHDVAGFRSLVDLYLHAKDCVYEDIEIDMSATNWFDADMCAVFGALLYRLETYGNSVQLTGIPSNVETSLSRNGFLSSYGRTKLPDNWGTTIPYQRFDVGDSHFFASYIEREFVHRSEMPQMSIGLLKRFRESVFEIFNNAVTHSKTKLGIFSCGQYYPLKKQLSFCIVDLGIGIRQNIRDTLGLDMGPVQAIGWATQGRNTTKQGPIPGGLGLKLLKDFIQRNGGCLQIVSDAGYWLGHRGQVSAELLSVPFPGTVVRIEINTADTQSHVLSEVESQSDIF